MKYGKLTMIRERNEKQVEHNELNLVTERIKNELKLVAAKLFMKLFEIRSKENYIYPEKMQIEVVEEEITRIKTLSRNKIL